MDTSVARGRLEGARIGHLATVTPDGRPHVVPCCFVLEGDTVFSAVDAKPKSTLGLRRLRNLGTNPAASLLVDRYDEDWSALWWVRADGTARILDGATEAEGAVAALRRKYLQYATVAIPGPVIALDVSGWVSWP